MEDSLYKDRQNGVAIAGGSPHIGNGGNGLEQLIDDMACERLDVSGIDLDGIQQNGSRGAASDSKLQDLLCW